MSTFLIYLVNVKIDSLKNNEVCGEDGISAELIIHCTQNLLNYYNGCLKDA